MITCNSGRIITKRKADGKDYYVIRLNLIDDEKTGKDKYSTKEYATNLRATKKNDRIAESRMEELICQYAQNNSKTYLSTYCDQWLESVERTLETTTYDSYTYRMSHIKEYFGNRNISLYNVTPDSISDFYHWLLFDYQKRCTAQKDELGLSNRTVKDIATLLSEILDSAVRKNLLESNPCKDVKIPKKPNTKKERPYISASEKDIFFEAIKGHRLEVPFKLTYLFGLRREEIAGLKWSAIRNGKIYIEYTVTHSKKTQGKERTKNDASNRDYPLSDELKTMLKQVKAKQDYHRSLSGCDYYESDFVFTWENGKPYAPDYYSKSFKKIVRQTEGLDNDLTLHSLRASCISVLVHENVDVKTIQKWVGHKDISTTLNIYARVNEEEKRKVSQKMSSFLLAT